MFRATKDIVLPTTITGSLPRPSWYTENLGTRHFLEAMVTRRFREQYEDALACYLRDQEIAGLDILTDGDCRFDDDVGGQSWTAYPPNAHGGLRARQSAADAGRPRRHHVSARAHPARLSGVAGDADGGRADRPRRSAIHRDVEGRAALHQEAGEVGRGVGRDRRLRGSGQALQERPVDRMFAIADAFNEEYHELADAGCPVIQIEEPQMHLLAARGVTDPVINPKLMLEVFNRTVKGLRAKTEVWAHSCWGNPSQQRMFASVQSYKASLELYNQVDADVVTFESSSSGGIDLEAIGKTITGKKVSIGVIDHHTLQVEQPSQVADQIRAALKHIPAERLMISTDCGMGREGMSRRHAFYKTVSLVLGTNIVRKELGAPEAQVLAADERYSLVVPANARAITGRRGG